MSPAAPAGDPARRGALVMRLADAIRTHVAPGMHLHFASTPSRSNAAIREVARAFLETRPRFRVSSTGFHSMAHLLPMLGLAERLTACFFGDHYPAPRPNALYARLSAEGVDLEHWSLGSMVASFRAGAQGDDWVVNRSLRGTSIARELAERGAYLELAAPEAAQPPIGLCAAMRPDLTFVHAAAADEDGHVVMSGPLSEGLWSALAARRGVIVTVERVVPSTVTRAHPESILLPPHRVLAICEEPFGAHPQPLVCAADRSLPSYRDDLEHYEHWRALTTDAAGFAAFVERVLRAPDAGNAYRAYVGIDRLAQLCSPELEHRAAAPEPPGDATRGGVKGPALPVQSGRESPLWINQLIVAGARQLAARARAIGARVLIAGIGQAFFAARIAQLQLAADGFELRVMVETGLYDVDCGPDGHGYLLAYENMVRARRLSSVDDILGVLTCGADNRCIAALGAAQIDHDGNLNSTRLAGKPLVGSGGACDIAASAQEAVVLTRLMPGRLVDRLEYLTSPGHAVRSVVTERCVLTRPESSAERTASWTIASLTSEAPPSPGSIERDLASVAHDCPWKLTPSPGLAYAAPITREEARLLDTLDPQGTYRRRAG